MPIESFDDGWVVRPKVSFFAQLGGPLNSGRPVRLPHDALIDVDRSAEHPAAQAFFPGGTFEYMKTFDVPADWATKRVAVEFGGVYRDAVVFVNGAAAAHRPYGYSSFTVELNPYLRFGEPNVIRVEARASQDSRWYTGAGIYRHTQLFVTDLVHVAPGGVRVTTPDVDEERAVVEVAVDIRNAGIHSSTVDLDVVIVDKSDNAVARGTAPVSTLPQTTETARVRLYVESPGLWSVDHPHLYTAHAVVRGGSVVRDEREMNFGIRTLRLDPRHGLRINGDSVKLRGACVHSDNGILGSANFARAEERKVEQLKAAGFNAIRSSHNPLSTAMLDACDRVGMLVMDEAFDVWTESKSPLDYSLAFAEWWERDIQAMVEKDINHPSVILYSIGNEIFETGDPHGSRWGRRIAEKVRRLDPTRFVTNGINGLVSTIEEVGALVQQFRDQAMEGPPGGVNDLMATASGAMDLYNRSESVSNRTAESFGVLDVAGMNYGDARYELDRDLFPNRIIVGSETFVQKIATNWQVILDNPQILGDFTWTGYDYLGEVGIGRMQYADGENSFEAPYPWIAAWCGDLDLTGYRRPQSYYREIVFGLRSEPFIAVHRPENFDRIATPGQWTWADSISSWSWSVRPGTPIRADVYADADEVELVLNGKVVGRTLVGEVTPLMATFELGYQSGELVAVSYRDRRETGRTRLQSATGRPRLATTADCHTVASGSGDLVFLEIELRDARGVLDTSADRPVTVKVEGPGVLQGLGSARPATVERYDSDTHTTFDGRALAIIRPTAAGSIIATVTAPDLHATTHTITVSDCVSAARAAIIP